MLRLAYLASFFLAALTAGAQSQPPDIQIKPQGAFGELMQNQQPGQMAPLLGRVVYNTYISPTGAFRIPIPVLQEMGGVISDTDHLVTFEDTFTTHISIAAFPQDATQRWQASVDGQKLYLINFFKEDVLPNFRRTFKDTKVSVEENARYLPSVLGGTFIAYLEIPGGTNFNQRIPLIGDQAPRMSKYGIMVFVKYGVIYVINIELAEKAIEGSAYHQTPAREDAILRTRLMDVASQIEFTPPPASSSTTSAGK